MALFKVSKGLKANLPSAKTEGYCWYTTDDSLFYIDYKDENGSLQRKALNAKDAETLTGASLSTILNSSDVEIPTSKAVLNALNEKLDKADAGSDWSQSDNTKPDYIKNRPFYESISLTTFLEEQQIDFSSSFTTPNPIVQGKTYFVHWDDAEYTIEATGKDIFGDGSIWIPYLEQADGLFTIEGSVMDAADKGIHNVAIYTTELSIKTIDEKFIPDTIARKDDFVVRSVGGHLPDSNGNVNVNYYDVIDKPPIKRGSGTESIMQLGATEASGGGSHAEGSLTTSSGMYSHAEGVSTEASGEGSHAEGQYTKSIGTYSHSEGIDTKAIGVGSHAEGRGCNSKGDWSHAEGYGTVASSDYQHVEGKFNIEDSAGKYANIVGNGEPKSDPSNAHTLDWSGNAWFAGDVYTGSTSGTNKDGGSKKLATEEYVDSKQVQPDWNQNDDTQPDYVKNRPFYTGDPVETVMLPETTITIVSGGENLISSSFSYSFELGKTYVITFDGVDTEYTAYEVQGLVLVGDNFSSVAGGSGYVVMAKNESIVLNTMDSSLDGSHTIAIKIYNQEIVKVDEKYLPESAFTYAEWSKISNKIVDYKQQSLSLSVSGEQIPMRSGNSYSENKINDNLKFENGKTYEINGSITLHNPVGNNASVLNINGHYTCSNGEIVFGSCYDIHYKKDIRVSLYSSDSVIYQGMLCVSSAINVANTSFTFDINITVTGEAKQLPDVCIGENIQRVGDDIILSSSTPDSTKQFKITVDDDYNVSATNTSDSVSKTLATTEYVDNSVSNPLNITSATVGQIAKISAVDDTGKPTTWETINIPTPFKPEGKSYLTFSSPNSFTLKVNGATKHWDGTLEYFDSNKTWITWDGTTTLSSVDNDGEHVLYLRGTGNTQITGFYQIPRFSWVLTGSDIKCVGNIENLLDYATVESGAHPTMADYCYHYMFNGCKSLTQAPDLPATTLASYCYSSMFYGCTSLTQAPALPATTLANYCYLNMFNGCKSLTKAPALSATTLADYCYQYMFGSCTSLTQAPALPATTLAQNCYANMFNGCKSLTQAPELPATTLAGSCYESMFNGCTSLTQAPALPATTLAYNCYYRMFYDCTALTRAQSLSATTLADGCYRSMFQGCTSLTQAPSLPATILATNCYSYMFCDCTGLKLSSSKTEEYTQEYRIPSSGAGTTATDALTDMFTSTGGTFTGTPEINTTYYLSSDNMIVHETEVATLNGYVGSMIDVAIGNAIGGSY